MSNTGGRGRHVLVTGASTGIGRETAVHLAARGFAVHAGVRRQDDGESVVAEGGGGIAPLLIDVTEADSIATAAAGVGKAVGDDGLWGLVNNAGIAVGGPLEFLPIDEFRRQIEVNLTGHVAVTQAFMPLLRRARGRIVNVTSIGGLIAFPFMGAYHAAKFGLEAVSDALRRELRPWGMHVSVVEPGSIATKIWERGDDTFGRIRAEMPGEGEELYGEILDKQAELLRETGDRGIDPIHVAKAIERALTASRPKTRYLVGSDAKVQARIASFAPDRAMDTIIARATGV
jgi:NAD(P)-dependent dehydrogenase (short-subunit alcohol dehydrogenase family)